MSAWFAWVMSAPAEADRARRSARRAGAPRGRPWSCRSRTRRPGPSVSPGITWIETSSTAFTVAGLGGEETGAGRLHGEVFLQVIDDQQRLAVLLRAFQRPPWRCAARDETSVPARISLARMQAEAWPGATGSQQHVLLRAGVDPVGAARREAAAGRRAAQVGRQALDGLELDAARQVEPRDRAHQADRVRVRGLEEDVVGGALLDDARRIHHVHAVGVARHDAEIVRDDDQRDAEPARQVLHQFEDLRLDGDVERGGRLVGDDELGLQASPIAIITRWRMPPER